ncbi:hypothetical protein [Aliidiomarina indica]|uniref:hypothetical protein n=1 Tax=Aliidiomarina indica TaxID=2749147 RepID=UPI00188F7C5F|nr:hypothetical protein [Aliidiomarina indica]
MAERKRNDLLGRLTMALPLSLLGFFVFNNFREHRLIDSWSEALDQLLPLIFTSFLIVLIIAGLLVYFGRERMAFPKSYAIACMLLLIVQHFLVSYRYDSESFGALDNTSFVVHVHGDTNSARRDIERIKRKGMDINARNGELFRSMITAMRADLISEFGHYMSIETLTELEELVCEVNNYDIQLSFSQLYNTLTDTSDLECKKL